MKEHIYETDTGWDFSEVYENGSVPYYSNHSNLSDISSIFHRKHFDIYLTVFFGTMLSVSMIFAIFGNLMTILIILNKKELRHNKTNLFLLSLAFADIMVGILVIPFSLVTLITERWIFPDWYCEFNFCINCVGIVTSIHTLMYIAIHKYLAMSKIGYYFHTWKCIVMIAAAWLWSITFAILTTKAFSQIIYKPKTMQCGPEYPQGSIRSITLLVLFQTFNFFLPLGIMAFAYIRIFQIIHRSTEFRRNNTMHFTASDKEEEHNVLKTLFIVLVCYTLCFTPYLFYTFYTTIIQNKDDIPAFLNPLAYSFGCFNSACNPVIYAWRFPMFRRGYRDIVCYKILYILSCGNKRYLVQRNRFASHLSETQQHELSSHSINRLHNVSNPSLNRLKDASNSSINRLKDASNPSINRLKDASNPSINRLKDASNSSINRLKDASNNSINKL